MEKSQSPPPPSPRPGKDVVKSAIARNTSPRTTSSQRSLPPPGRGGVTKANPLALKTCPQPSTPKASLVAATKILSKSSEPKTVEWNPEKIKKNAEKRVRIVEEIVKTEETYVTQLQSLQRLYITPMKDGTILPVNTCNTIFSNITSITETNLHFLVELHKEVKKTPAEQQLGKLFVEFSEMIQLYHGYCRKNVIACHLITKLLRPKSNQQKFKDLHQKAMQDQFSVGLNLNALLITPVQRVPRYRMLLQELLKVTPTTHADYKDLCSGLATIKEAAMMINEAVREEENRMELRDIGEEVLGLKNSIDAPGRKFIKRGPLKKVCRSSDKIFTFFLFSDMLMYGERRPNGKIKISHEIPINAAFEVKLENPPQDKPDQCRWSIKNDVKSFVVYGTKMEKDWFDKMSEVAANVDTSQGATSARAIWTSDKDGICCVLCEKNFTVVFRRHHCRACGMLVCGPCSKGRIVLPGGDSNVKVRACKNCVKQHSQDSSTGQTRKNPHSLFEGFLQKKSRKNNRWNLRYCILVGDNFIYYKDDTMKNQLGEIDLNQVAPGNFQANVEQNTVLVEADDESNEKKRSSRVKNMSGNFDFLGKSLKSLNQSSSVANMDSSVGRGSDSFVFSRESKQTSGKKEAIITCYLFVIKQQTKEWCFKCNSEEERDKWLKNLRERKDLNRERVQGKKDEKSLKEGVLRKQGGTVKNWQERYFVLTINSLAYYKDIVDSNSAGTIDLTKGVAVKVEDSEMKFMFTIKPKDSKRIYCLVAASDEERGEWMDAIRMRKTLNDALEDEQKSKKKEKVLTPKTKTRTFVPPKGSVKLM